MTCECSKFRPFSVVYDAVRSVFNPKPQKPREQDSCLESAGGGLSGIASVIKIDPRGMMLEDADGNDF